MENVDRFVCSPPPSLSLSLHCENLQIFSHIEIWKCKLDIVVGGGCDCVCVAARHISSYYADYIGRYASCVFAFPRPLLRHQMSKIGLLLRIVYDDKQNNVFQLNRAIGSAMSVLYLRLPLSLAFLFDFKQNKFTIHTLISNSIISDR